MAEPPDGPADLWGLHRAVVTGRLVERAVTGLAAAGIGGGHHSALGQEALAVGIAAALGPDDAVQPTHRSRLQLALARSACGPGDAIRAQAGGGTKIYSSWRDRPATIGIVGLVGSQVPMAVGVAWADQLRGRPRVTVICFGDGAANEGAVHESLNLAAARRLPVVFVVENNGLSVSTPIVDSTGAVALARRADGYGMPGWTVAGHDAVEVRDVVAAAVARARAGHGPALVEALVPRWEAHATGLAELRDDAELARVRAVDGVATVRAHLVAAGAGPAEVAAVEDAVAAEVDAAVADVRRVSPSTAAAADSPGSAAPDRLSDAEAWRLSYAAAEPA